MANVETSLEVFCEDLLIYVFSKLSENDLISCKCVSKEWNRIITDVCIPALSLQAPVSGIYFRIARLPGRLGLVRDCSARHDRYQLLNELATNHSVHIINAAPLKDHPPGSQPAFEGMSYATILPFHHHGPDFLDCCNGLILFVHRPKPSFYVCNPAIKQCVSIPLPPSTLHLPSLYASLAFDPSESLHYRIVISSLTAHPQCLLIFYSQTGEWIKHDLQVELPLPPKRFRMVRHCVYLKGILYRLSLPNNILCFNLEAKTVRVIVCPDKRINLYPRGCFGVLAGSLVCKDRRSKFACVVA